MHIVCGCGVCLLDEMLIVTPLASLVLTTTSRAPLVVPASAFERELAHRSVTSATFVGVPLASQATVTRGKVLTAFARRVDADLHPGAVLEDAVLVARSDGKRRGVQSSSYDWSRDSRRVACKSSSLSWDASNNGRWVLSFQDIQLRRDGASAAFDELLLAAYTPRGVHLFRHDLRSGVTTKGKTTTATGKKIVFYGPRDEPDWRVALVDILGKMEDKGCKLLAFARFDEPRLAAAIAETPWPLSASTFAGVPLADCSATVRGEALVQLVRRLDECWLNEGATFTAPEAGRTVDGKRRRQNTAEYCWCRDGRRVACKSAALSFAPSLRAWKLTFANVKLPVEGARKTAFDELLLAVYTPRGVYVHRHDLRAGVATNGVSTAARGKIIQFVGPRDEPNWVVALDDILGKMGSKGCKRLAFVPWTSGLNEARA